MFSECILCEWKKAMRLRGRESAGSGAVRERHVAVTQGMRDGLNVQADVNVWIEVGKI